MLDVEPLWALTVSEILYIVLIVLAVGQALPAAPGGGEAGLPATAGAPAARSDRAVTPPGTSASSSVKSSSNSSCLLEGDDAAVGLPDPTGIVRLDFAEAARRAPRSRSSRCWGLFDLERPVGEEVQPGVRGQLDLGVGVRGLGVRSPRASPLWVRRWGSSLVSGRKRTPGGMAAGGVAELPLGDVVDAVPRGEVLAVVLAPSGRPGSGRS